jgi:hypothetical protein
MAGGAWRFALVSLGGFGPWALEDLLLPKGTSEIGLYVACLVFFVLFAEIFLAPLVIGPDRFKRFNKAFVPAFVLYAVAWSACWFAWKFGKGEWVGLAAGCTVFAIVLGKMLGAKKGYLKVIAVLIAAHAAGYFLGAYVFSMRREPPAFLNSLSKRDLMIAAKLSWGLFYGLGFGAGIGYAFQVFQPVKKVKDKPRD